MDGAAPLLLLEESLGCAIKLRTLPKHVQEVGGDQAQVIDNLLNTESHVWNGFLNRVGRTWGHRDGWPMGVPP